jgi:hypothetical protein
MATVINAGQTALTVTPDATGQLTLQANGVTALTANTTGYLNFAKQPTIGGVEWPAFSAYVGTNQSVSASTYTKVACNVEEFDTANCYNTSTYRFTPNVAGYYQFNGQTENVSGGGARIIVQFYKNGSEAKRGNDLGLPSGNWGNAGGMVANALIYCNGTTDYVEFYIYDTGGQTVAGGNSVISYFQGFLVRAA